VPLSRIKHDVASDGWWRVASGKGVLVLAELRRLMGDVAFVSMMDEFGRQHAGQAASTSQFTEHAAKYADRDLSSFFDYWLNQPGLPRLELVSASASSNSVQGVLRVASGPLPASLEATVEFAGGETTSIVPVEKDGRFEIKTAKPVTRLVVDKYARMARANGNQSDLRDFELDLDHSLIVYGTRDDEAANREAAEVCQKAFRAARYNVNLPVQPDRTVTEDILTSRHLILIGRPAANTVTERLAKAFTVTFGAASFTVRGETCASAHSTIIAAGINPLAPRLTLTVIAGNSGTATYDRAGQELVHAPPAEVMVYNGEGKSRALVIPAPELVKIF
jgi:hypothetical protein